MLKKYCMDHKIKALLGFLSIAALMFFPVITKLSSHVLGDSSCDVWVYLWLLWWLVHAILQFHPVGFSDFFLYPSGCHLLRNREPFLDEVLALPLKIAFNNYTLALNLEIILSLIFAALGAYLLVNYLVKNKAAAFISGIIYGFSPYAFSEICSGRMHLVIGLTWIPFYMYYLLRLNKEKGYKNAVFAGLFLSLMSLSSFNYAMMFCMATVIFYLICIFSGKKGGGYFIEIGWGKHLVLAGIIFAVSFLVFFASTGKEIGVFGKVAYDADKFAFGDARLNFQNSINPVNFFITREKPNYVNNMFHVSFFGYTVVFLFFFALFFVRPQIMPWMIIMLVFFVLSWGPALKIGASKLFLPYFFLRKTIPFFYRVNFPYRFSVVILLSLSVIAGFAVSKIQAILKPKNRIGKAVPFFLGLVIILEYIIFSPAQYPPPVSDTSVPWAYYDIAKEKGDFALIEIPFYCTHPIDGRYLYFQTVHGKRIFNGIDSAFVGQEFISFAKKNTLIRRVLSLYTQVYSESMPAISKRDISELKSYKFKYIVVHNELLDNAASENLNYLLTYIFGNHKSYDNRIDIYDINGSGKAVFDEKGNITGLRDFNNLSDCDFNEKLMPPAFDLFKNSPARGKSRFKIWSTLRVQTEWRHALDLNKAIIKDEPFGLGNWDK